MVMNPIDTITTKWLATVGMTFSSISKKHFSNSIVTRLNQPYEDFKSFYLLGNVLVSRVIQPHDISWPEFPHEIEWYFAR